MYDDTICAPATPPVNSTLAIIRISGSESNRVVNSIFSKTCQLKSRHAYFGSIIENKKKIDDVILIYYSSPGSFTGEDMIEIICHGNQIIVRRIMGILNSLGVRLAEPGEFSKRAFLNGKIDLTEAEAINHVIRARSDWEIDAAIRQMHGSLKEKIDNIRELVIELKADIETGIDFIDQEIEFFSYEEGLKRSDTIFDMLKNLIFHCKTGEKIIHGIDVKISGKPNVGKSSILNLILNQERAIVSDIPGTTRDIIRESLQVCGFHINLIDTAGINDSDDKIEMMGINLSRKNIESASIILMVIDASTGLNGNDREIINKINEKKVIYIINKIDIAGDSILKKIENEIKINTIRFSAKKGRGVENLLNAIGDILKTQFVECAQSFIADFRVINLLEKSIENITRSTGLMKNKEPMEIVAFELQSLLDNLSEIVGEITPDDILNSIFSRFCIGK